MKGPTEHQQPVKMSSQVSLLPKAPVTTVSQLNYEEVGVEPVVQERPWWLNRWKRAVIDDLRCTQWVRFGYGYLLGIWLFLLLVASTTLPIFLYESAQGKYHFLNSIQQSTGCLPNDVFDARSMKFNIFEFSNLFQITHGFGDLTFTQVKVIDVIWDVVVGRVGQGILSFFSWKAFSTYFKNSMNKDPVTYNTFWIVFVNDQPTIFTAWQMIRDFSKQQTRRSKGTMAFIILNILFIVSFPTLIAAMTGYRPNTTAYITDTKNALIPFDKFRLVAYVIHDADRIGLGLDPDYPVPFISSPNEARPLAPGDSYIRVLPDGYNVNAEAAVELCRPAWDLDCHLGQEVSRYVEQFGFFGLNNTSEEIVNTTINWDKNITIPVPGPALNISAFYLPPATFIPFTWYGYDWVDPRTNTTPFSNPAHTRMYIEETNATYSLDYIEQNGSCQRRDTYQWGFSFLQVLITTILLLIWSCGTYIMWLGSHKTLGRQVDKEVPQKFKAALIFVSALNLEMARIGKSPETLTNQQLLNAVKENLAGGRILTQDTTMPVPDSSVRSGIWKWIKAYRWWFIILLITTVYLAMWLLAPYRYGYGQPFVVTFHTGMVFAVVIGRTRKSRFFFVLMGILVSGLLFIIPWVIVHKYR